MKINGEIHKMKDGYRIELDKPTILICYGRTLKEVFTNLKIAFIKLQDLNQLNIK